MNANAKCVCTSAQSTHEQDTDCTLEFISISIYILFKSISITVSHVCNPVGNNIKRFPWSVLITKEKRELEKHSWFKNLIWDAVVHTNNGTIRSANAKINTSIIECVHSLSHHPHKVNYRALFICAHFFAVVPLHGYTGVLCHRFSSAFRINKSIFFVGWTSFAFYIVNICALSFSISLLFFCPRLFIIFDGIFSCFAASYLRGMV